MVHSAQGKPGKSEKTQGNFLEIQSTRENL